MARVGFAFGLAAFSVAVLTNPATSVAGGLVPLQSDSACAAFVAGWQPGDYIRACAQLIAGLKDTKTRCEGLTSGPTRADARTDPQNICANPDQIRNQLAAAFNDRAYFLILSRGSDNYRLAIVDLNAAIALLDNYWLALRNRAVAHMLLGEFDAARADFTRVAQAVSDHGTNADPGRTFVRPTGEAEVRLGLGYANLGLCNVKGGQEQLVEAERLALGPVGADLWVRAAAMFGQGLGLKVKGADQSRIAATNTAINASEKARLERYARQLFDDGAARMAAAAALVPSIRDDVAARFRIEEASTIAACRRNPLGY